MRLFSKTRAKYLASTLGLLVAFLMNPLWGCGDEPEPEFQFEEQEMVDYAQGSWTGDLRYPSGEETHFELQVQRADESTREQSLEEDGLRTRRQPACGTTTRQFIRPADACAEVMRSVLPITGTFSTDDGEYDGQPVDGELIVEGAEFERPRFRIAVSDDLELDIGCDDIHECRDGYVVPVPRVDEDGNERSSGSFSMQKQ